MLARKTEGAEIHAQQPQYHITPEHFKETYGKMLSRAMMSKEPLHMNVYVKNGNSSKCYTIRELLSYDDKKIVFLDKMKLPTTFSYESISGLAIQELH